MRSVGDVEKNGGEAEDFGMNVYRKSFKLEM
jgi:hypothetical protein